ncbi:MAG: YhcH/YjgK/YiaL family protein [Pirellulaceae bacterium]
MILDRLDHASMYRALGADIARAFDYLQQTNFRDVPDGRYELDGERLFALVLRYPPKPLDQAMWEAHRRYLDIQYVVAGSERMGYTSLCDELPVRQPYDPQKDIVFFEAAGDWVEVPAGSFAIFAPHDVHAPGLAAKRPEASAQVCKVVVKCQVRE